MSFTRGESQRRGRLASKSRLNLGTSIIGGEEEAEMWACADRRALSLSFVNKKGKVNFKTYEFF